MRLRNAAGALLLVLSVSSEWVKIFESPKSEGGPSEAWIKYQEERRQHRLRQPQRFADVKKFEVFPVTPQSTVSGKIEMPQVLQAQASTPKLIRTVKKKPANSTITSFINFLKNLQDNLIQKGKTTIMDKIKILTDLKNRIVKNIGEC